MIPAAVVAAGINAAAGAGQAYAQGKTNRKTRQWNEMMYAKQRQDNLADWQMQNAYNSPQAQMQRYREAGLNPNLIYGQQNEGATVRSADVGNWNPQTPDISGISRAAIEGIGAYQDYTIQQEQVKNMQAQRNNMELDSLLKSVELSGNQVKNAQNSLELQMARDLYDTSVSMAKEKLRQTTTGTDISVAQEARNAAIHAPNLETAIERLAAVRIGNDAAKVAIANAKRDGTLKDLEINLRKLGFTFSDNVFIRIAAQALQHYTGSGSSLPELLKRGMQKLEEWKKDGTWDSYEITDNQGYKKSDTLRRKR